MNQLIGEIKRFLSDEEGLTTVEYAIAGGVIATGVIVTFTGIGDEVKTIMDGILTDMGGTP